MNSFSFHSSIKFVTYAWFLHDLYKSKEEHCKEIDSVSNCLVRHYNFFHYHIKILFLLSIKWPDNKLNSKNCNIRTKYWFKILSVEQIFNLSTKLIPSTQDIRVYLSRYITLSYPLLKYLMNDFLLLILCSHYASTFQNSKTGLQKNDILHCYNQFCNTIN